METAGKNISDETYREAIKEQGLGTPATRAAIIETLFRREYLERPGKSLIPTEKGLFIYDAIKDMRIADVEMTGQWEKLLSDIETKKGLPITFMKAIKVYTRQITKEILALKFTTQEAYKIPCPKCGTDQVSLQAKFAKCDNAKCEMRVACIPKMSEQTIMKRVHYTDSYLINPQHPVTVNLIGAGGTGSQVLTCLARLDVTLYDPDEVTEANIERQLFGYSDLGLNKVVCLISRINNFFGND